MFLRPSLFDAQVPFVAVRSILEQEQFGDVLRDDLHDFPINLRDPIPMHLRDDS